MREKNKRSVCDENNFYKNLFFEALAAIHHQEKSFKIVLNKQEKDFENIEQETQLSTLDAWSWATQ